MAVEARNSESQSQHHHHLQPRAEEHQPTPSSCTEALIHHQVAMVEAKIKSAAPSFVDEAQPSKRADKDNNTVTIVQTNSSSQVLSCHNSQSSPVLVTVTTSPTVHHPPSSSSPTGSQNLQVLAQL